MSIRTSFTPMGGAKEKAPVIDPNSLAGKFVYSPLVVNGEPDYHNEEVGWHIYKFDTGAGTTWCVRGNCPTNYVRMGKSNNNYLGNGTGSILRWRVLRINEDGSVRMILHEPCKYTRPVLGSPWELYYPNRSVRGFLKTRAWDYMSEIPEQALVKTAPFYWDLSWYTQDEVHNAARRILTNDDLLQPKLYDSAWLAPQSNGWYQTFRYEYPDDYTGTVLDLNKLETPLGLMNGDEAVIAGAVPGIDTSNTAFYSDVYSDSQDIMPAAPHSAGYTTYCKITTGRLSTHRYSTTYTRIRPVINIRGDIEVERDGAYSTPFLLVLD